MTDASIHHSLMNLGTSQVPWYLSANDDKKPTSFTYSQPDQTDQRLYPYVTDCDSQNLMLYPDNHEEKSKQWTPWTRPARQINYSVGSITPGSIFVTEKSATPEAAESLMDKSKCGSLEETQISDGADCNRTGPIEVESARYLDSKNTHHSAHATLVILPS